MVDSVKVGKAISFLRKRAGFTQADLAERIGISDKAVSKWERGLSFPDITFLVKLSILLDTDTDSLLMGDVISHDSQWGGVLLLGDNSNGIFCDTRIYDNEIANILFGYFMLLGIKNIIVSCPQNEMRFISSRFRDGSEFGIKIDYSDSLSSSLENYQFPSCVVVFDRFFVYGVDQTRFLKKAMINRNRFSLLALPKIDETVDRILFDENRKNVIDDSEQIKTQYDYSDIPIAFCPKETIKGIQNRDDFIELIRQNKKTDSLYFEILDRGFVGIGLSDWDDVAEASSFVRTVEKACGMKLYSIEEIAWRRGLITNNQLISLVNKCRPALKKYLTRIVNSIN